MIHLVTFADDSMSRSANLCIDSARAHGVPAANTWIWWAGWLKATSFYSEHRDLLGKPRGLGFWAWKPFVVQGIMLAHCQDGDILIYADAGIEFINNVSHIIDRMDQDIFLFGNNWEHAHWCKRDIIEEIYWDCSPPPWTWYGKQAQASVIFFRVSDLTREFVREWLHWCLFEGGRLIDDSPSRTPNHPEFQENRHDQAILTTLAYREGIKLHWWPASYNDGAFTYEKLPAYASDDYPILFNHHRKRNHEWSNAA